VAEEAPTEGTLGTYAPSESGASRAYLDQTQPVDLTVGQMSTLSRSCAPGHSRPDDLHA
jgi:hypothetical protein